MPVEVAKIEQELQEKGLIDTAGKERFLWRTPGIHRSMRPDPVNDTYEGVRFRRSAEGVFHLLQFKSGCKGRY